MNFDLQALDELSKKREGRGTRVSKFQPQARARPRPTVDRAAQGPGTPVRDTHEASEEPPGQPAAPGPIARKVRSLQPSLPPGSEPGETGTPAILLQESEGELAGVTDAPLNAQNGPATWPVAEDVPSCGLAAAPGSKQGVGDKPPQRAPLTRLAKRLRNDPPQCHPAPKCGGPGAAPSSGPTAGGLAARAAEDAAPEAQAVPQLELAQFPDPEGNGGPKKGRGAAAYGSKYGSCADKTGDVVAASGHMPPGSAAAGSPPLAQQELDVGRMPLKQIIAWSYAREKARADLEKQLRDEAVLAGEAPDAAATAAATAAAAAAAAAAHPKAGAAAGALVPQVQVVDGQIVIAPRSLEVQAQPQAAFRRVVEDTQVLNSNTYRDCRRPDRWTIDETNLFYKAVRQFGTDFSLMERIFPGRQRRTLKKKFNKEERANPARLTEALQGSGRGDSAAHQYRALAHALRRPAKEQLCAQAGDDMEGAGAMTAADPTSLASMLLEGIEGAEDTLGSVGEARAAAAPPPPRAKRKYTFHARRPRGGWTREQLLERQRAADAAAAPPAAVQGEQAGAPPPQWDATTDPDAAPAAGAKLGRGRLRRAGEKRGGGVAAAQPAQPAGDQASVAVTDAGSAAATAPATLEQDIFRPVRLRSHVAAGQDVPPSKKGAPAPASAQDKLEAGPSGRTRMDQLAAAAGMSQTDWEVEGVY